MGIAAIHACKEFYGMNTAIPRFLYLVILLFPIQLLAQDIQKLGKAAPVTLHGSCSAGLNDFRTFSHGKDSVAAPPTNNLAYFIQASPVLTLYGYSIPFSLLLTSQSKSFNYPVYNRFGLSPSYKWIKLHLGWQSLNFSQFTLSGQQMLGAGFELTPGKFRAGFMYGKFNNAVTDISTYNNLNNNTPLYKRTGWAAKIGYGSPANFVELSYLQAKDDSNSIPKAILDTTQVKPAANQVAGLLGQLTIRKRLTLRAELAASYYTRNNASDTFNPDNSWSKLAYFPVKTSSRVTFAEDINLNYRLRSGSITAQFRRVDPNYQSMGAYYMQTDVEQYTVGFSYGFLQGKLHLQASIGLQRNNLSNTATDNTHRTIGNLTFNITPSNQFGVDLTYSNYGISQQIIPQLSNPATIIRYDSIRISEINQSITITPHILLTGGHIQHSISLVASFQLLSNTNPADTANENFASSMSSLIYSLIFPDSKWTISNTFNYFNTVMTGSTTATLGYNLGISKELFRAPKSQGGNHWLQSVTASLYGGYFENTLNSKSTGQTISVNPTLSVGLVHKETLQLTANYTRNNSSGAIVTATADQLTVSARYNINF
jgi:hypothetical protein